MAITRNKLETGTSSAVGAPPPTRPSGARRVLAALGLALLSGALATLAFPPFGAWPLIFVAFAPMIVAQHRVAPPRWSGAVFGLGIGTFIAGQLSAGLHQGDVAPFFELMPLYFAGIFTLVAWRSRR